MNNSTVLSDWVSTWNLNRNGSLQLKIRFSTTLPLDLLNYHKFLHSLVHERSGQTLNILTQLQRNIDIPVSYLSFSLDLGGKFYSPCLRAIVASDKQVKVSTDNFKMPLQHYSPLGNTILVAYWKFTTFFSMQP